MMPLHYVAMNAKVSWEDGHATYSQCTLDSFPEIQHIFLGKTVTDQSVQIHEYVVLPYVVLWLVRICIPGTHDLMFQWVSCTVAVLTETLTASVLRSCLLIFWPHNVTLSGPPPVQIATACNIVTRWPWHSVMRCSFFSGCPSQLLCSNH